MRNKKFARDYEVVTSVGKNGRKKTALAYRGDHYLVNLEKDGVLRHRKAALLLSILIVILHTAAGFANNEGMRQFFTAIPYVFAYLPIYFILSSAWALPREKRPIQRDEAALSYQRLKTTTLIAAILIAAVTVANIVYLIFTDLHRNGSAEVLFMFLESTAAAAAGILYKAQIGLQFSKVD